MRPELADAIESARTAGRVTELGIRSVERVRGHSFDLIRALVLAVVQELPSEMTAGEIAEELSIANNQAERRGE